MFIFSNIYIHIHFSWQDNEDILPTNSFKKRLQKKQANAKKKAKQAYKQQATP